MASYGPVLGRHGDERRESRISCRQSGPYLLVVRNHQLRKYPWEIPLLWKLTIIRDCGGESIRVC